MKKGIALIATIALCFGLSTACLSEDTFVSEGTASSTVTYHVDSSYIVRIPATIDANSTMVLTADSMDIADDEIVRVKVTSLSEDNKLTLHNPKNGGDIFFMLSRTDTGETIPNYGDVGQFKTGAFESTVPVAFNLLETAPAGDYSGTIEFSIALEKVD